MDIRPAQSALHPSAQCQCGFFFNSLVAGLFVQPDFRWFCGLVVILMCVYLISCADNFLHFFNAPYYIPQESLSPLRRFCLFLSFLSRVQSTLHFFFYLSVLSVFNAWFLNQSCSSNYKCLFKIFNSLGPHLTVLAFFMFVFWCFFFVVIFMGELSTNEMCSLPFFLFLW